MSKVEDMATRVIDELNPKEKLSIIKEQEKELKEVMSMYDFAQLKGLLIRLERLIAVTIDGKSESADSVDLWNTDFKALILK